MKQKFLFLAIVLFTVLSAQAQTNEKLVVNAGNAEHIIFESGMNIILMPAAEDAQSFSLDIDAARKLGVRLSGNDLTIYLLTPENKEKLTVYVYLNSLKAVTAGNNTHIKTNGVLNTPKLDVFVDGDATAHLKTTGTINAYALFGGKVEVKDSKTLLARH